MRSLLCTFVVMLATILTTISGQAQTTPNVSPDFSLQSDLWANLSAELTRVPPGAHGTVWLIISARYAAGSPSHDAASRVTLRIPISSTEDVYGESRSCSPRPDGSLDLVFTAGMDEKNFLRFASTRDAHRFHLLVNKYLCRALAAPFHCGRHAINLPQDWKRWRIEPTMHVIAEPVASAVIRIDSLALQRTATPFDRARCAVVAPSNGICCVAGKTTEWHCGGTPVGRGWHQVSGECFHRETGGSCHD